MSADTSSERRQVSEGRQSPTGSKGDGPVRLQSVRRSRFWWYTSKYAVLLFSKIWFRIRCENADRLPKEGPVLLVANHASYLDPPMVGITATRWVGFLAQAGLASFAPLRWWLGQVGVTLIDRNAPSKASMRLISDCLKAGEVVGIFPEGTRSRDGRVGSFKSGVEFLVRRTRPTVVPIGIDGSFRAFPRGAWLPRPRKIIVRYGQPWTPEQVLAKGGIEALRSEVASLARCELTDPSADHPADPPAGAGNPAGNSAGAGNPAGNPAGKPTDTASAQAADGRVLDSDNGRKATMVDSSASARGEA